jgi:hypothetical protein
MAHAWVTRADTPEAAYEVAWEYNEGVQYLGIPFRTDYVKEVYLASKRQRLLVVRAGVSLKPGGSTPQTRWSPAKRPSKR